MEPREHADELTRQRLLRRTRRATPIRQRLADKLARKSRELQAWLSSEPAPQLLEVAELEVAKQLVQDAVAALQLARELLSGEVSAELAQSPARARLLGQLSAGPQSTEQLASALARDRRSVQRDLDQLALQGLVEREPQAHAWRMRL